MARIIAIGFLMVGVILIAGIFDPRIMDWFSALFGE